MMKLAAIEWMKLRRLNTMKVILLIYAGLLPTIYLLYAYLQFGPFHVTEDIYLFPDVYAMMAWTSSIFNLIIGVIIIVFTCNEIKYKTQRQNVIDGLNKREVILSKFIVVFGMSVVITLYTFLLAMIFGLINGGTSVIDGIEQIGVYFVMTLGYFAFAYFFANLVRLPALAIILYLVSTTVEEIIGFIAIQEYVQFFPLTTFSNLVPFPTVILQKSIGMEAQAQADATQLLSQGGQTLLAFGYLTVFVVVSYLVIKRRDI
ncbi:ABC transporter permease [Crocinitomicaceae bacterium]|nr:ABC transporter permease [Crocinitomicaceae bacterium]